MSFNIQDLNKVNDDNQQNWPEGTQKVKEVNNAGRADEGMLARWFADWNGSKITAGTATAYTITSDTVPTAYYDGFLLVAEIHVENTGAATLNADSLGAVNIVKNGGEALEAGDLPAGHIAIFVYRGTDFNLIATKIGSAGTKNTGTAIGDVVELEDVSGSAGLPAVDGSQLTGIDVPPSNGVWGLECEKTGNTDFRLSKGGCYAWDADSNAMLDDRIDLTADLAKSASSPWTEGAAGGSLDSGTTLTADAIYSVYAIKNPTSGAVDVLVSSNHVKPNTLPTDYTLYRQISALRTDSAGDLQPFVQVGSYIRWLHDPITQFEYNGSFVSDVKQDVVFLALPWSIVEYFGYNDGSGGSNRWTVDAKGAATSIANSSTTTLRVGSGGVEGANANRVLVDGNRTAQYWAGNTGTLTLASFAMDMLTREAPRGI